MNLGRALLALLCLTSAAAGAGESRVEGVATRLDGGDEVYRESHVIGSHVHRIEYHAPDGTLIATKSLDYGHSDSAPAFEQHDLRCGARTGGRWDDGGYVLLRDADEHAVPAGPALVASSGFDRFVRAHWNALNTGARVEIDFAVPDHLRTVRLRVSRGAPPTAAPDVTTWFRIDAASPVLRLLMTPIELGYDRQQRLRVYRGPSNLCDTDGGAFAVEIRYQHEPA